MENCKKKTLAGNLRPKQPTAVQGTVNLDQVYPEHILLRKLRKLEMTLYNSLLANKLNALTGYHKKNVPVLLLMHNNVVLTAPFKSIRSPFHGTLLVFASGGSYNPGKFKTAFSLK